MPIIIIPTGLIRNMLGGGKKKASAAEVRLRSGQAWLEMSDKNIQMLIHSAAEKGEGDPVPELLNLMAGQNDAIRTTAAQALGLLYLQGEVNETHRIQVMDALIDAVHDGVKPNQVTGSGGRTITVDQRATLRAVAAEALAQIADPRSVDGLISALTIAHPGARRNAALGLGRIRDPRAVPALAQALNDQNPDVRATVIESLRQIGTPEALDALNTWRSQRQQG